MMDMFHQLASRIKDSLRQIYRPRFKVALLVENDPAFFKLMKDELEFGGFEVLDECEFALGMEQDELFTFDAIIGEFIYYDRDRVGFHELEKQYKGGPTSIIYTISKQRYEDLFVLQPYPRIYWLHSRGITFPIQAPESFIKPDSREAFITLVKERIKADRKSHKTLKKVLKKLESRK